MVWYSKNPGRCGWTAARPSRRETVHKALWLVGEFGAIARCWASMAVANLPHCGGTVAPAGAAFLAACQAACSTCSGSQRLLASRSLQRCPRARGRRPALHFGQQRSTSSARRPARWSASLHALLRQTAHLLVVRRLVVLVQLGGLGVGRRSAVGVGQQALDGGEQRGHVVHRRPLVLRRNGRRAAGASAGREGVL